MLKTLLLVALLLQEPAFKISGTVVREDNQDPAQAARSNQIRLGGAGAATVINIGAGGSFEFPNVRPGTYQLVVGPQVAMQPVTVVVTDKDVSGVRLVVPVVASLAGTVTVNGDGPRPRFQLTFTRIDGAGEPINLTVLATFTAQLPPGEYRITSSGLPAGYTLRSPESLKVVANDSQPLAIVLGVSSPPPWVKVSGRVNSGAAKTTATSSVIMAGTTAESLTAPVNPDGSFEFPRVLPGSYTARTLPANPLYSPVTLAVGSTDMTNVEIRLPASKEVDGRIVVQGNVPVPRLQFALAAVGATGGTPVPVNAQPDGSFRIALPEGERQLTVVPGTIPPGYVLDSFTYGSTDLLKNPLRVAPADTAALRVALDARGVNPVKVTGRVTGLLTTQGARVILMGSSLEAPVNADGSFTFEKVLPGNYNARLSLSGISASRPVAVANRDVTDVVINYPREFVVTGHVIVEGGLPAGAAPQVVLEAKSAGGTRTSTNVNSGVIMLNLKDGEHAISVRSIPSGYQLRSIMFGMTDLQKTPLTIDGPVTWEIIVRLAPSPPATGR